MTILYIFFLSVVVLISLIIYALSGGADFGGGMWDLLARGPRARRQREVISHAIAPIWEANHVWLILVIVILFSGFPMSFGVIMTALHIPMSVLLIGIVLRGSTFVFRSYDRQDASRHAFWSALFGQASFFTPFLLGLCLGALASGDIRIGADGEMLSGFFAGWTRPFAISCGLFAQGLFAFLAATYLTVDAAYDPEVQDDFRRRAIFSCLLLLPAAALVFVAARHGAPYIFHGLTSWWAPLLLALTSASALLALISLWRRWFRTARYAAMAQVTFILLGWGFAQYPYLVVPDLTFATAAAPESTLRMLAIALTAGALLLFPSFVYLFRIFKPTERAPGMPTK